MLNRITLQGRLTRDPEVRYTKENTPVTRFAIAVDRDFGKEKSADFIDCVAWRQTADFVGKYISKGDMVIVDGSLQNSAWTDKNGSKHNDCVVAVNSVHSCGRKSVKDGNEPQFVPVDGDDDNLPF